MINQQLLIELLQMQKEDQETRRRLIDEGVLYGPNVPEGFYHPDMALIHRRNNQSLREITNQFGWPGYALVGEEGCEAAWSIAQHGILDTPFQERWLSLLELAVKVGDAPAWQFAKLTDRLLMQKGEPQIYGTIMVGGDDGKLIPWKIADPDKVERRRQEVGLPSLEENLRELQNRVDLETRVQKEAKRE